MKIKKIEVFPIRVKNNFDTGRNSDTKNINTAMLEIKNLKKTKKEAPAKNKVEKRNLEPKSLGNYETNIKDMGEYYVDEGSATSIYSKSHETTVVKIETENGIVGCGEAQTPVSPNTTATIIKDIVEPLTIGKDIYDVESIWHNNYSSKRERGHYTGFYIDAICGVDIAIWDAIGKSLNMPTCKAMGGAHRKSVALYNVIGGTEPEEVADQAEWSVSKGYKFVKMHLKENLEKDIEIARKVR